MNETNPSFGKVLFKGSFVFNPVLTQAIGICSVVAVASNIKTALVLSAILTILLLVNELLASLLFKKLSRWVRVSLYTIVSILILTPVMFLLDKKYSGVFASLGIYVGLLAVNGLIVIRCEKFAVRNSVGKSLVDAFAASLGYFVVAVICGAVREYLAFGTIFSKPVTTITYSAFAMPFGGLIVLGFLSAFHKWLLQKKFRAQPKNTFNLRTALDEPLFRAEGINSTSGELSFLHDPQVIPTENSKETKEGDEQ